VQDIAYEPKSVFTIGRCLARLCRYAGSAPFFYSVFQHSLVCALLVPPPLRIHAACHDISEAWTQDVVSLYKREGFRQQEHELLEKFYKAENLTLPTAEEHKIIKEADKRCLIGEIWVGAGEYRLREQYPDRDREAEDLTAKFLRDWPGRRLVETDQAGFYFEELFHEYKGKLK